VNAPFDRCLFILADGARPDVLEELLAAGDLPNISRFVIEPGGYARATTVFPSTTGPAYVPFLTGRYPGPVGVPGIRWFDSDEFARRGVWGRRSRRSYVGPASFYVNSDLEAGVPTLFDRFNRPSNIFSCVNRGVGFWGNATKAIRATYWLYAHWTDRWHLVDGAAERMLLSALHRQSDMIFVVFPGIDEFAHLEDPFSDNVLQAYRSVDHAVGSATSWLSARGQLDRTLIVLSSDHGLTATHTHFDPGDFLDSLGYRTLHYPFAYRSDATAAFTVSGNGMGHVSIKTGRSWSERPFIEDLESAPRRPVQGFLDQPEIDLVAGPSRDGGIRVLSGRGGALIHRTEKGFTYQPADGDPLGIGAITTPIDEAEALRRTVDSTYPDALVQLWQIFQTPRSGHLILSAAKGCDLRSSRYENPDHKASHGSLHREHMLVPLAMNTPFPDRPLRTVDTFPTMLSLTGRDSGSAASASLDGRRINE